MNSLVFGPGERESAVGAGEGIRGIPGVPSRRAGTAGDLSGYRLGTGKTCLVRRRVNDQRLVRSAKTGVGHRYSRPAEPVSSGPMCGPPRASVLVRVRIS